MAEPTSPDQRPPGLDAAIEGGHNRPGAGLKDTVEQNVEPTTQDTSGGSGGSTGRNVGPLVPPESTKPPEEGK